MWILSLVFSSVKGFIGSIFNWFTTGNVILKLSILGAVIGAILLYMAYGSHIDNITANAETKANAKCVQKELDRTKEQADKTDKSIVITDKTTNNNADEKTTVAKKASDIGKNASERVAKADKDEVAKSVARIESLWDTYCLAGSSPMSCQIK